MGQLGYVATSEDCVNARASVARMESQFETLGSPAQYAAQVQSISNALDNTISWYSDYIPFNQTCEQARMIGKQADALVNTMTGSTEVGPSGGQDDTDIPALGIGALVAVGALLYFGLLTLPRR